MTCFVEEDAVAAARVRRARLEGQLDYQTLLNDFDHNGEIKREIARLEIEIQKCNDLIGDRRG